MRAFSPLRPNVGFTVSALQRCVPIALTLRRGQLVRLVALQERLGLNRSAAVRMAVDELLAKFERGELAG